MPSSSFGADARGTGGGVYKARWLAGGELSNHPKNKKTSPVMEDDMGDDRVFAAELSKAITEFEKHISPISECDIVKMNPGL